MRQIRTSRSTPTHLGRVGGPARVGVPVATGVGSGGVGTMVGVGVIVIGPAELVAATGVVAGGWASAAGGIAIAGACGSWCRVPAVRGDAGMNGGGGWIRWDLFGAGGAAGVVDGWAGVA